AAPSLPTRRSSDLPHVTTSQASFQLAQVHRGGCLLDESVARCPRGGSLLAHLDRRKLGLLLDPSPSQNGVEPRRVAPSQSRLHQGDTARQRLCFLTPYLDDEARQPC